jgi:D-alanyl-D-alanine carboxypeptidase
MRDGVPNPKGTPVFPRYGLGVEAAGLTCGEFWGGTGQTVGFQTMAFSDAAGQRQITLSMNVERLDPKDPRTGPLLLAAVNAVNTYLCGDPYEFPKP